MTSIPLNGVRLRIRLIEVEVNHLKLDPENPRLHSAYLTHELPARPNEKQIAAVLEQLPEFQALLDAIARNDGVFQPPLITADFRVLEGNRRVTALRKLHAAEAAAGANLGAEVAKGGINQGYQLDLQANRINYEGAVSAAAQVRDASFEAARLRAVASVVSAVGHNIARVMEQGLTLRY
jgi:hypothetical protein